MALLYRFTRIRKRTAQQVRRGIVKIRVYSCSPSSSAAWNADDVIDLNKGPGDIEGLCLDHKLLLLDLASCPPSARRVDEGV